MIYVFFLLLVAFLVLFERKILRLSQIRKGPNIVGLYRILQTIVDRVKLILKNFILLKKNEFFLFVFSPILSFFLSLLNYFFFLFFFSKSNIQFRILFNLFIRRLIVYTVLRARWGSSNSYSLIRSLRAVAQIISYEVVLSFFILFLLLKNNSFSWLRLSKLNIISRSIIFFFFIILRIVIFSAELNRTPFDLVEGESELVRRYNVEYSRIRFTFLFLAEYLNIWFYSFVIALLFFNIKYILIITFFFIIIFCWIRALLPRFKFLDLINLIWKILLPIITILYLVFLFLIYYYKIKYNNLKNYRCYINSINGIISYKKTIKFQILKSFLVNT